MLIVFGRNKYNGFKLMCRLEDISAIETTTYSVTFYMKDGKRYETHLSEEEVLKIIDEAQFPDKFKAEVNK